ncbi:MAG TPA: pyruvate kinase [Desulfotomaculum sp.]|nr:MAG: Pyruvate kinase [Desulfotomaculum sp. 46_80]KUK85031.1 MAG: Pyruvate kinase [Desulfofundulus kuznetsovii]HAG10910.1 pyruvate kinase [Desulfotomaculum sp.]HBY03983.1 pyruvate kinase [Desulfotomaculum sp.]
MKRTRIVSTIGPASGEISILEKMMNAGLDVARLNFSHGTREEHLEKITAVREAAVKTGKNIAVLMDTRGPEVRLGRLERPVQLNAGQCVVLVPEGCQPGKNCLPVSYADLSRDVKPGNKIILADGQIELKVISTGMDVVECEIIHGGEISGQKGVNLPEVNLGLPFMSDEDRADILFGIRHGVDFIALSFVRAEQDILTVRKILEEENSHAQVIAKIESREGLANLSGIIRSSDGIMVARGDLGIYLPVEEVPLVQKEIVKMCSEAGKPVIVATQMLETMINNPSPTRAEVSDVANAILDGADAVMLSGETAIGRHPVESVEIMKRIAERVENSLPHDEILAQKNRGINHTVTDAISHATVTTARDLEAAAIITSTQTGYTALMISKYRPRAPIIAVTPYNEVLRRMALFWGVQPLLIESFQNTDQMIDSSIRSSLNSGMVKSGDLVVVTAGIPPDRRGTTNFLKVHIV